MPEGVCVRRPRPSHARATTPVVVAAATSTDPPSPAISVLVPFIESLRSILLLSPSMSEPVLVSLDGHIATLTLNVPDKRNAMSAEMTDAFPRAVDQLKSLSDARAVIVTGAGAAFCAGGDLDFLHTGEREVTALREKMSAFYPSFSCLLDVDVPTIAAVNGPAIGAGLCLALACDLRYAASSARLGAPFVKLGMHPGMAATYLLPNVVGDAHARDLLLTGRIVDAEEALRLGLVSRVLPDEAFPDEVLEIAEQIAS